MKHLIAVWLLCCFGCVLPGADLLDELSADVDRIEMHFWRSLAYPDGEQSVMVRTTFNKAGERAQKIQDVLRKRGSVSSYGNIHTEINSLRIHYLGLGTSPARYYDIDLPETSLSGYEKEFMRSQRKRPKTEREALSLDTVNLSEYENWMVKIFDKYHSKRFSILAKYKRMRPDTDRAREKQLERVQNDVNIYMEKIRTIRLIIADIRQNIVTPAMKKQQAEKRAPKN